MDSIPFQLIDPEGQAVGELPDFEDSWLLEMLRQMVRTRCVDHRMTLLQRAGRIGFVGPTRGMEATVLGTAAALEERDWLWSGLREGPAALMRGLPLSEYVAQMMGNGHDTSKGRQMSNHFQHRATRFPSWSSVLGTQIPNGVGAAFAAKQRGLDEIHAIYFGDGATSGNGFHSGLNLGALWKVPAVFVCTDNGWAISVPSSEQSATDTFADKAPAYGIPGFGVDGNDILACYSAMKILVERARAGEGPALLVPRTYRILGHSSADDPDRYRDPREVEEWKRKDPLARFQRFLSDRGTIDETTITAMEREYFAEIDEVIHAEERASAVPLEALVEDVYATPPAHLCAQLDRYRALDG
jgi:pyruvate dehydrogenase E1 component alpha subunit